MQRALVGALLVLLVAASVIWFARLPIADEAIRRLIAARGVTASYTVKSIGLRWERIENLSIGDPKAPDLTAEWAEIRVAASVDGVKLRAVRAGGVRVRGKIVDGRLRLGSLDKLLGQREAGSPILLPDLDVELLDARVSIDSKWGQIGARIDGKGNLADGFSGKIAAIGNALQLADCRANRATAYVDVSITNRQPTFKGPIRATMLACDMFSIAKPVFSIATTLNRSLDQWRGDANLEAAGVTARGASLTDVAGRMSFNGEARQTKGKAELSAKTGRLVETPFNKLMFSGSFATGAGSSVEGQLSVARLTPDLRLIERFESAARSATDTPAGPLLRAVAQAARRAAAGLSVSAEGRYSNGTAAIIRLGAKSASGSTFQAAGGNGIRWGTAGFFADTVLSLAGGGFPTITATLQRQADGRTSGVAQLLPFAAGDAWVALSPVRFAANPAGAMRFETVAQFDGPVPGGRIDGLRLPLNATIGATGSVMANNGCTPVTFRRLLVSSLTLNPADVRLCPVTGGSLVRYADGRLSGGMSIRAPRLTGAIGTTPIALAANEARIELSRTGFTIDRVAARIGTGNQQSKLKVATLGGRFVNGTLTGRFGRMSGKIGAVPILFSEASGSWAFRNGALSLDGRLTIADEMVPGRFNALTSDDAVLRLVDSQIAATATLREPVSGTAITRVAIGHDLRAGSGKATLNVVDLTFNKSFQPEQVTRLTLGVIANVNGAFSGRGDIAWGPGGVTSSGRFSTQAIDLAAAFGPVSGLKGEIFFSDLLAMATPPGQRVTIASINPGTLVTNGLIAYQLLPGQTVAIESGDWPFAGGALILDPTTFAFGQEAARRLTFRVVGLDAAKFIQQLEFENLAATGTFDGILPMYFDANGGRIEGGRLVVRQGGGTLAYVGEISNAAMNVYAKLAFDALKSIRYDKLTIELNGALDGEIVSQIDFNGINEAPLSPPKSYIARQFIGLPFVFNIKVTAPFRNLLNTARTFQDPSSLLQRTVPELRQPLVQPPESEPRP